MYRTQLYDDGAAGGAGRAENFPPQNSSSLTVSTRAMAEHCGYRSRGISAYWKHTATSPHFWKRNFFSPERRDTPSEAVSCLPRQRQQVQPLDGTTRSPTCSVGNPGRPAGTSLLLTSFSCNRRSALPPLAFLFSSVKLRCDVAKYNEIHHHKLLGYPWMESPVLN